MSMGKAPRIWFRTARQVHQYLTCPIGDAFAWGDPKQPESAIKESGAVYVVSEKTVYNHTDDKDGKEKLRRNRANAFARRTVDLYAKTHLGKVVAGDADPSEPVDESELTGSQASAVRRVEADAKNKEIEAKLKELRFQRELGKTVPTAQVERELGERAQSIKLNMTSFMRDFAPELLSCVGGDLETAREMIRIVDGDEEKAELLSAFVFGRRPLVLEAWKRRITGAINAYAKGEWFTDDMREAWERYETAVGEEAAEAVLRLIELVGGDSGKLGAAMERFDVRMQEGTL
ncbi:hypothetical protein LF599_04570 [Pseudodesulfovibrio thermohalotolerans]|uniref:hypothetical protein n=1 Tax=Pseudodesulfovibrio thermohalotolerans TaxID=2880651 RepID=UPI0024411327|nr:hypothetical protein [Pseudodesulfovibrio thermohalotolerans]WFS63442.1 hypothetical protein LF599_04570 [Pseudodesulfovibrio thermohalotolerans]